MAAYRAFLNPDPQTGGNSFAAGRIARYDRYWALWQNNAYDDLSTYMSRAYPANAKLYRYTRGLRNKVKEYTDFYQANIWGGVLDGDAGDGKGKHSALPIATENAALRPAIAKLWQWSNWAQKRQLAVLYGVVAGDAMIYVADRPQQEKVFMQVRWPGDFTDLQWDEFGNVKKAVIEYTAKETSGFAYQYKEVIEHPAQWGGSRTRFSTFRNGQPYGYEENDGLSQWEAAYDFVPVVHIPFMDVGTGWGAVGFTHALRTLDEASALASLLSDQIGKAVNPPQVAYGMSAKDLTLSTSQDAVPMVFIPRAPGEAKIEPMIYDLNLGDGLAILNSHMETIQEALPELRFAQAMRQGMSGEALGRAFADVMAKVAAVRGAFDGGLVRAQHMAIAIAGERGYQDFGGFGLGSYASGALDHDIGDRPVLPKSEEERAALDGQKWQAVAAAVGAGLPLAAALEKIMGWEPEEAMAYEQRAEQAKREAAQRMTAGMAGPGMATTMQPPESGRPFRISWSGAQQPAAAPAGQTEAGVGGRKA